VIYRNLTTVSCSTRDARNRLFSFVGRGLRACGAWSYVRSLEYLLCLLNAAITDPPVNYGIIIFPSFQALDVFGPLDILNMVSADSPMSLSVIASTLEPVSTQLLNSTYNPAGSRFAQSIVPTHTFAHPPKDLDVLIVPGGIGTRAEPPALLDAIDYIKHEYPRLQYIMSVCTGATLLAHAGVLDGKKATTNKKAWAWATSQGPKVEWVPAARWVTDGNVWTTSGVAAGLDGVYAFVGEIPFY
jgi:putative intracellular protease/amidase